MGAMPLFYNYLSQLLATRHRRGRDYQSKKTFTHEFLAIAAIIPYFGFRSNSKQFQVQLAIYLHSMGVKIPVIGVLAGVGLIPSYKTIMDHMGRLAALSKVSDSVYCSIFHSNYR
jgi:hypothetical protein